MFEHQQPFDQKPSKNQVKQQKRGVFHFGPPQQKPMEKPQVFFVYNPYKHMGEINPPKLQGFPWLPK